VLKQKKTKKAQRKEIVFPENAQCNKDTRLREENKSKTQRKTRCTVIIDC